MIKYNLYIEIEETGKAMNPFRFQSIWDCKDITSKDVYNQLKLVLEKWVRILDEEAESHS
jgi:hypothetical protein